MSKKLTDKQKARKAWVRVLRSGKYKQGYGLLHYQRGETERFCCLGVLCDLAVKKGIISKDDVDSHAVGSTIVFSYQSEETGLPPDVTNWIGLNDSIGSMKKGILASKNDTRKYSFERIADLIEAEPEGLFKESSNA